MVENIDLILRVFALIVGVIAAIFGFLRLQLERRKSKPVFLRRTTHLVDNNSGILEGIEISYKGESVQNVTITNVAVWNAGKKSLRSNDVPISNKIRIAPKKDVSVFEINILKVINEKNNFEVNVDEDNHCYELDFEYISYKDGIILQLIHDGTTSSDIEVIGGTIDYGEIKNFEGSSKREFLEALFESKVTKLMPAKDEKRVFFIVTLVIGLGLTTAGLFTPLFTLRVVITSFGLLYLIIGIFFRRFTSIPKEFAFMEE